MAQQKTTDFIPFYHLYGEHKTQSEPGFVHLEDIASRSSGLHWEIAPHRHQQLTQFLLVLNNRCELRLDGKQLTTTGNTLIMIPPGVVHGFVFAPDTQGYVLSVHNQLMANLNIMPEFGQASAAENLWRYHLIQLSNTGTILTLLRQIAAEINGPAMDCALALTHLLSLFLIAIKRELSLQHLQTHELSREARLLLNFRSLLDAHFHQHLTVSDYASRLYVSASTLNRACQHLVKESPKALIQQRVLTEAKRRLIYTRQSVEQVAATLGFKDHGYFCRFFKLHTQRTAQQFREQNEQH
jgi:AraC family transcriptional activator of pobA